MHADFIIMSMDILPYQATLKIRQVKQFQGTVYKTFEENNIADLYGLRKYWNLENHKKKMHS